MGFTAINDTSAFVPAVLKSTRSQTTDVADHPSSDSIAAAYLGRGEISGNTQISAVKKSSKRISERTAASGPSSRKRAKVNNNDTTESQQTPNGTGSTVESHPITNNLHVAKPRSNLLQSVNTKTSTQFSQNASLIGSQSYATSVETLKSSAGYGCTIYDNKNTFVPISDLQQPSIYPQYAETVSKKNNSILTTRTHPSDTDRNSTAFDNNASPYTSIASNEGPPSATHPQTSYDHMFDQLSDVELSDDQFFEDSDNIDDLLLKMTSIERPPTELMTSGNNPPRNNVKELSSLLVPDRRLSNDNDTPIGAVSAENDRYERASSDENSAESLLDNTDPVTEKKMKSKPRTVKQNTRLVHEHEDYGGALLSESERQLLESIKEAARDAPKPIVRRPFPTLILDRSPIHGVSNSTALRTCFRIGEALNIGCNAVRLNQNVFLEFFARVTVSWRDDNARRQQHFVFKDLYHDKPPYMHGTFELWGQSSLWNSESETFLAADNKGMLCRAIAQMKRDGTKWRANVLNIWKANWHDIDYTAGIYTEQDDA